jgi:hypothetical protein
VIRKSNQVYDGDWIDDKRQGYGVLSSVSGSTYTKIYAGSWLHDKRHVRSLLAIDLNIFTSYSRE